MLEVLGADIRAKISNLNIVEMSITSMIKNLAQLLWCSIEANKSYPYGQVYKVLSLSFCLNGSEAYD